MDTVVGTDIAGPLASVTKNVAEYAPLGTPYMTMKAVEFVPAAGLVVPTLM
jgi:hypothetical protein